MSEQIYKAVLADRSTGGTDKLVLLILADYAERDGSCYGSAAKVAEVAGMSERAAWSCLKRLQDSGHIKKTDLGGLDGDGNPIANSWQLNKIFVVAPQNLRTSLPTEDCIGLTALPSCQQQTVSGEQLPVTDKPGASPPNNSKIVSFAPSWFEEAERSEKPSSSKFDPAKVPLPFPSPKFREAWNMWVEDRRFRRKWLTPGAVKLQFRKMKGFTEDECIAAIEDAIEKNWTGIFPKKANERERQRYTTPPAGIQMSAGFAEDLAEFRSLARA